MYCFFGKRYNINIIGKKQNDVYAIFMEIQSKNKLYTKKSMIFDTKNENSFLDELKHLCDASLKEDDYIDLAITYNLI